MRNNIIPVVEEDVEKFASKNQLNNYTDDDICRYEDFAACSLYEFTIENITNISQSIFVSMTPTLNEYNNLYFMVYESKVNKLTPELEAIERKTYIDQDTIDFENLKLMLYPGQSKTYTIVFYVKSLDVAQDDAGKRFAASIEVNSLTTGYNEVIQVGKGCYDFSGLKDGTIKLTKFNGIDHTTGEVIEACNVTKDENGFYSVTVPSTYAKKKVSTLGNSLFYPIDIKEFNPNDLTPIMISKNYFIKELTIEEGITTIEDGIDFGEIPQLGGTYRLGFLSFAGVNTSTQQPLTAEGVKINLPNSLKYLGDYAFNNTLIKEISSPNNLEYIGNRAFANNPYLTEIFIPASVKEIGELAFVDVNSNLQKITFEDTIENPSQLKSIGNSAFQDSQIINLEIPSSVETIGEYAFYHFDNNNLTTLTFVGAKDGASKLKSIGKSAFRFSKISTLEIPASVETIGEYAFYNYDNNNLTTLTFVGAKDGTSKLKSIGDSAFHFSKISTLEMPKSVETIGEYAFSSNGNLTTLTFVGVNDGTSKLKSIGDSAFQKSKISTLEIPASVETIGEYAFYDNSNLTTLTFVGAKDGTSSLKTIGEYAFLHSNLTYLEGNPLFIPSSVTYIGTRAFGELINLEEIKFNGNTEGFGDSWNGFAEVIP